MKLYSVLVFTLTLLYISSAKSDGPIFSTESFYDWYDLRWIDDKIAIMLSFGGRVSLSNDTGQTWTLLNPKLIGSSGDDAPAFLYPSPNNPDYIYIRGGGRYAWNSMDRGATWTQLEPPLLLFNLDWHPTNTQWCLAADSAFGVYYTYDFGASWNLLTSTAYAYTWGDAGIGEVPVERVYLTVNDESYYHFVSTDDFGKTINSVQPRGFDFRFGEHQIYAVVEVGDSSQAQLKVSTDIGKDHKDFYDAEFPSGTDLEYRGYSILDDHTGAVYMGVNHDGFDADYGTLYISDSTGTQYATSLRYIHQEYGYYDFQRIEGIDGVYIANRVKDYSAPQLQVVSVISFDNGATWLPLKPPHFSAEGQPIQCQPPCSLHIHSWSSYSSFSHPEFAAVLSSPNAVGLIIANGNIGQELSFETNEVFTFLSRDGGLTWRELYHGPSYYQFGDHGAIILIVPSDVNTDTLYYTLDQGNTSVIPFVFSSSPVTITAVTTEVSSKAVKFTLLCHRTGENDSVVGIDFSKVYTKNCDINNDYEFWSPSNGYEDCLLGHNTLYRRRIPTRDCFNDFDLEPVVNVTNCVCTEDDWECDYNYNVVDGVCMSEDGPVEPNYPPEYCRSGSQYYKTKGYRKEAGNTCEGGVDHSPEGPFDCPEDGSGKSRKGWIAAAVLVPLVLIVLIIGGIAVQSDRVREKLPFLKFLSTWKVGYSGMNQHGPDTMDDEEFQNNRNNNNEDDEEKEDKDFSIQAEEIEEKSINNTPNNSNKNAALINLLEEDSKEDDFNPRK